MRTGSRLIKIYIPGAVCKKPVTQPILTWSINPCQKEKEYTMEKGQPLEQMVQRKMDSYMQKNKIRLIPHTIYKNKHKTF